jgi:NAD(P)-dependent dehydrogenase (short-subunit alcohol dehydrogenase family)
MGACAGSRIPPRWRPGPIGVRVNSVNPGGVDGPRLRRQLAEAAERSGEPYQTLYDNFAGRSALGKMSTDIDVANAVLCSC